MVPLLYLLFNWWHFLSGLGHINCDNTGINLYNMKMSYCHIIVISHTVFMFSSVHKNKTSPSMSETSTDSSADYESQ